MRELLADLSARVGHHEAMFTDFSKAALVYANSNAMRAQPSKPEKTPRNRVKLIIADL